MVHGPGDGGSEFEFNCLSNQKEWLHLAKYCIRLEAEGERRGRIVGLREASEMSKDNQPYLTQRILGRIKTLEAGQGK